MLTSAVAIPRIDYSDIPEQFWPWAHYGEPGIHPRISAVCRSYDDCLNLRMWFGGAANDEFCPFLPVLLVIPKPDGSLVYSQIDGMGAAPIHEIKDMAVAVWEITVGKLEKDGKLGDTDKWREWFGYRRAEDAPAALAEHFEEVVKHFKANARTEPSRQFKYPNPTGKTLHAVPDGQEWKEAAHEQT